jgi:hypothetical protein
MTAEVTALSDDVVAARAEFLSALEALPPARLSGPRLVGEWSARELVAHLGYWAGHAVEVIHAVEGGREPEMLDGSTVDARNETVARIAREADLATARKREAASVQALLDRLAAIEPALLSERLPDGATLAEGIREDASQHYREHTAELRAGSGGR